MSLCSHQLVNSNFALAFEDKTAKTARVKVVGVHTEAFGSLTVGSYAAPADVDQRYDLEHTSTSTQPSGSVSAVFNYGGATQTNPRAKCRVRSNGSVWEIWMDQDNEVLHVEQIT